MFFSQFTELCSHHHHKVLNISFFPQRSFIAFCIESHSHTETQANTILCKPFLRILSNICLLISLCGPL